MTMDRQIGLLLDLVFDFVNRDEPVEQRQDRLIEMCHNNDRIEIAFDTFLSWFKPGPDQE